MTVKQEPGLPERAATVPKTIEFFFDFSSPYAYLAHTQLPALARRHGCSIAYHPVGLSQVKQAAGNVGPSFHLLAARRRYVQQDAARWARRYGVPLAWAADFDSAQLNRGAFLAIERDAATAYVDAAGRRVWAEGRPMNGPDVLRLVAGDLGWEPDELLHYASSPESHAQQAASLALARERKAFGVPTMVVDNQIWWGNDRLSFIESYLSAVADAQA